MSSILILAIHKENVVKTSETLGVGKSKPRPKSKKTRFNLPAKAATVVLAALVGLGAIYWFNMPGRGNSAGKYKFQVGNPGPGQTAPPIRLASDIGGTFDLASVRGRTVLLYFQEGLTCQPCWDQLKDIEKSGDDLRALGIDLIVSITTDPVELLRQKAIEERLHTPILSDPDLAVSKSYQANSYGMMGTSRDGHTFVVIGPDGQIKWRADYGGAPDYTMYLPVPDLLADIRRGLGKTNG
jgi:peroxiredoxin